MFFHFLVTAQEGAVLVDAVGQFSVHHVVIDGQGVDAGLHQEDLVLHHPFQEGAAHIPVGGPALGLLLLHGTLDVRDQDDFVADDGDGLVHESAGILLGGKARRQEQGRCEDEKSELHINKLPISIDDEFSFAKRIFEQLLFQTGDQFVFPGA